MRAGLRPVIGRANSLLQRQTSAPSTLWRHFSAAKVSPCVRSPRHFTATPNRDAKVTIVVPQMAESISEGTLATLYKQVGDRIEADEEIASIETDKIDITVNAPESGKVVEVHVAEGDTVTVGQTIATMETGDSDNVDSDIEQSSTKSDLDTTKDPIASSKAVEPTVQVDKDTSVPSLKDMPSFSAPLPEPPLSQPPFAAPTASQQQKFESQAQTLDAGPSRHGPARNERVEKLPRIRQTIARRLKESQNRTASLTTVQHVDMSALIEWRKRYKESVMEKHGVRLGYMGAFTKAATLAALQVPAINAYMDMEKETITYRDYVDVSIAVSTPKGLVTPVLRNCESMDIIEMERGIMELGVKARDSKLMLDDLNGGNFTISNPGIFGSMFGTPLINYPQSAVFNMNSIRDEAVVVDGKIEIRPMMYITITYDHRLIDGREAVTFLSTVKNYIQEPSSMLLASLT